MLTIALILYYLIGLSLMTYGTYIEGDFQRRKWYELLFSFAIGSLFWPLAFVKWGKK